MENCVLSLDQGTTSSRAILFSPDGKIISSSQYPFEQHFPNSGWVEHDPYDILNTELRAASDVVEKTGVRPVSIGITNQRETTIVWEKESGKPVFNAIVWQCRRTSEYCEKLIREGYSEIIKKKTGLGIDAYFSATKIKWILDHIENGKKRAENGELLFGTVDSWLIYNLTGGKVHATDYTNASRTMLFNIHTLKWDSELCDIFGIPLCMLPEVRDCAGYFGTADASKCGVSPLLDGVTINGVAGDQQASLFGQTCFSVGDVKNTYGTGCFTLMNIGSDIPENNGSLITTVGWRIGNETVYALEGSVFNAGSSIQWLRDGLGIITSAREIDGFAEKVSDNGGVYLVSAFTGLGAPYWDMYARGTITGITRGTTKYHICRAALEGIAFQVYDLVTAMKEASGKEIASLRVDGGASVSDFMMQFQSDILDVKVERPEIVETTAMGAAFLSLLGKGVITDKTILCSNVNISKTYSPVITESERQNRLNGWKDAIKRTISETK